MGEISIRGQFVTGDPYQKLQEESFLAQVRSNFNWYSGDIGTIDKFSDERILNYKGEMSQYFKDFVKTNPQYKTKESAIKHYLCGKELYLEKGELIYAVDYSTPCGYEIVTAGGKQEIDVRQLPELWIEHLEPGKKGYKAFELTANVWNKNLARRNIEFTTLKEAEEKLSRDMVLNRRTYFVISNNRNKAYMLFPNIKTVKTTTRETDHKDGTVRVDKAYPVYFVGQASC